MELELESNLIWQVLKQENIGIWRIRFEPSKESAMKVDDEVAGMFGLPEGLAPDETFRYWYDSIHEDYNEEVLDAFEQMKDGKQSEVQFVWRHPKRGLVHIRCCGIGAYDEENGVRLEGFFQDVTKTVQIKRKVDRLSKKTLRLESESRENELVMESLNKIYFAVHHLNMVSAEFTTSKVQPGVAVSLEKAKNMYEAMDILCETCVAPEYYDRMKVFTDLSTLRSRLGGDDMISEEYVSMTQGWVNISFIVADRNADGEITDIVLAGRRINREKKEARVIDNMLRALSSEYQSVYRINVNTDECFSYRMSNAITGQFGNQFAVSSYAKSFRTYKEQAVIPEDWPLFEEIDTVEKIRSVMKGKNDHVFPYRVFRGGKVHHFVARLVHASEDAVEYVFGFKNNDEIVEEQKQQERRLREALEKAESAEAQMRQLAEARAKEFRLIHETLDSGMWFMHFDGSGQMSEVTWSDEIRAMIGYENEEDFPNTLDAWFSKIQPADVERVRKEYYDTINDYTGRKTFDVEYQMEDKEGEWHWFHTAGRLSRREDGAPESYTGIFADITEKKLHQRRTSALEKQALQDSLTGLSNRRAYDDAIERITSQDSIENVMIIAMDLDYLKRTNDSLGHAAGDELLCGAADCIRESFGLLGGCYRIGGDEFAVLIEKEVDDMEPILEAFAHSQKQWSGKLVKELSISYGYVSAKSLPFVPFKRLLQIADENMYKQKMKKHEHR